jgi:CheY-like chemotaxis protein
MSLYGSVLIVEDDPANRQALQVLLAHLGCNSTAASSGEEALRMLRDGEKSDVIISDMVMPGMNGLQFADKARAIRPELPILLVTGDNDAMEAGLRNGLFAILKPYSTETMRAVLTEALLRRA